MRGRLSSKVAGIFRGYSPVIGYRRDGKITLNIRNICVFKKKIVLLQPILN